MADDFVPVLSGDVSNVVLWMVHTGVQPANIFIRITKDNGDNNPNTATLVTSGLSSATHVDTGDLFPGDYPIYRTTCTLPTPATVAAGDTYWLEVDMTAGSLWCVQIPVIFGSTVWFYSEGNLVSSVALIGQEFDSFFELHNSLALEANTWGAIKASF
ncbi:MAG: hypothetical protein KAR40_10160 [Candidatus Sabulitectum sp.]|nr:hypothetical protein [Candidatus Sabulitectum sp.]